MHTLTHTYSTIVTPCPMWWSLIHKTDRNETKWRQFVPYYLHGWHAIIANTALCVELLWLLVVALVLLYGVNISADMTVMGYMYIEYDCLP